MLERNFTSRFLQDFISRSSIISPPAHTIISPSASGGGASAKALAGGGLSLLIYHTPREFATRPRTPPTSAEGENIGKIPL